MERITGPTVDEDLHGAGKDGFTEGDPGLVAPTIVSADWLNGVQEEILNVIEGAGLTPSSSSNQMFDALKVFPRWVSLDASGSVLDGVDFSIGISTMSGELQNGGFSVAPGELTVPDAGVYLILFALAMTTDDVSDPAALDIVAETTGSAFRASATGYRWSNQAGDPTMVVGCGLARAAAAGEDWHFRHTQTGDTLSASGRIIVVQLLRA